VITSADNDRLRLVRKLRERRWREKLGLFACEGEDLVAAASAASAEPVDLLVAGENVAPRLFAELSSAAHPPRVIGVYRRADLPAPEPRAAVLALWRIADPGNLGTLIRSADAFGAAVALSERSADPTAAKALRASAGSIWRVPLLHFEPARGASGERRIGLVPDGGAPLGELDLRGELVFCLGAEREGLPAAVERELDASIPIRGAESLNVAAAGAIALYEWARQNPA
jgi:TrmH family RNA methyltransferase